MPRTNLIVALFALLVAAVFAGPAMAHGSGQHAIRTVAVADADSMAQAEANVGLLAIQKQAGVWPGDAPFRFAVESSSRHAGHDICPEADGSCCDYQCCVGMDLIAWPDIAPAFASEPVAAPAATLPSDATPENQLRPPCR